MAGRREWVEAALGRYERPLVAYARSLTGNLERAREIVQEVFLRLWQQDPTRLSEQLGSWLYTVCRHLAVDVWRKERRMIPVSTEALPDVPTDQPSPEQHSTQRDALHRVQQLLGGLTARQQEVVRLKFQQDLSYKEIGAVLGMTVSHVGVTLHQAMQRLRALGEEGGAL